jgi:hypothetical protein
LAEVYGWFIEALDAAGLREAKALLEEFVHREVFYGHDYGRKDSGQGFRESDREAWRIRHSDG